ncbi:MAG: hypothetical protein LQ349_003973 [Xanthoria aureola]|nr:MAG: hypothetical protein LQ349_003973 [Xanthoria aureola]
MGQVCSSMSGCWRQKAEQKKCSHCGVSSPCREEKKTISGRPAVVDNDVTWEVMMSSIAPCSRNEGHSDIVSVSSPWANRLAYALGSAGVLLSLFSLSRPADLPLVAFMFIFPAFGISAAGDQHYRHEPVISAAGDQHYRQEPVITTPIQPYVDNPWAVIRFPGRFPPPGNNSLVPRLRRGPSPDPAMYSLRMATPSRLSGRIQHYGPVTVLLSSCFSTRGAFSCDFIIIRSASSRRSHNRGKPRKPQRLITWYDPVTVAKDAQKTHSLVGSLSLKRNAGAKLSVTPAVTVDSSSADNGESRTSRAASYANASTQTDCSTDTTGDEGMTTMPVDQEQEGSDFSGHDSAASDDGSEDNAGDKVWANRSTMPVEELDVAAWAEAAMVSQANTIAENEQLAMQQSASIARLQAAVENQDGIIAAQADATRVLQLAASKHQADVEELRRELAVAKEEREGFRSRCLRGAFACADKAKKESAKAKELEEELQAEKIAREADARTAQEVLAASQKQSEADMATVINSHQTVVSNTTASQSQAEATIRKLEGQVRALEQGDSEKRTSIKELKQQLEISKARLLGQAPFFERKFKEVKEEKEQLSSSLAATAQQLKEANAKVKDLEVTDECRVAALEDCAEEGEEKDARIEGLEAENEELKAEKDSLNGVLAERATELSSLKAAHEILEAMHKQAQSSMMTLQYSAQKNLSERDAKIAELDAANKTTQLENAALIVTINAERAQHQERHEADIRSLQRDVFSRDQRLRSFENEVAALRSELTRALAAAAAVPVAPAASLPPSLPSSSTPLPPSSIPLPPSPTLSPLSTHYSPPSVQLAATTPSSPRSESRIDFLTTAAGEGQRLITWPYSIPTLSITWQEPSAADALAVSTDEAGSDVEADPESPPEPPAAAGAPPSLDKSTSNDKTPEVDNDKSDQSKGEAPRETSGDGDKDVASGESTVPEDATSTYKEPEALKVNQPGQTSEGPEATAPVPQPPANDPEPVPADGTVPALVQETSSGDKEPEVVNDIGDEPMQDVPRGTGLEDGGLHTGDAGSHPASAPNDSLINFDQPMSDLAELERPDDMEVEMSDDVNEALSNMKRLAEQDGIQQEDPFAQLDRLVAGINRDASFAPAASNNDNTNEFHPPSDDVNMEFGDLLFPVQALNESGNTDQIGTGEDVPMGDVFAFGQTTSSAQQQPGFQGFGAFAPQAQHPTQGFGQMATFEGGMPQTTYPDPAGMGPAAPSRGTIWAPGPQPQRSGTNTSNEGMEGVASDGQVSVDDQLTSALNRPAPRRVPNKKKALPRGVAEKKRLLPKRVAQLSGSAQASASGSRPTLQEIFGPYMNQGGGNATAESSNGGVGNENPFIGSSNGGVGNENPITGIRPEDWNLLQQQPVQVCDSGRDNPFGNQAGGNHNGDNAYIDPRLLSLSSQDQWQPTQPQQPSANPEPEVGASPASPSQSELLDAEYESEDDSGVVDTDINPFSGEPWKPGELEDLMRESGEELYDSTPVDYEVSPFTGKPFPKPSDQSPAPQSTEPTAPEDSDDDSKDRPDKGKGKEPLQPTQGVPPSQRAVNPIRRRRPKPVAADFFSAPPEQNPFDGDDEGDSNSDSDSDSEDDRKKKARPHFTTTTDDELLPDDPRPSNNNEDDEDDPANFPVFNDSTLFHPSPSSSNAYTAYLNQTVAAQRQVKAAWSAANPNPDPYNRNPTRRRQGSVSSDEDEMAFEDAFPDEPEVGSKGNGYGSKRRGRDGELVDAPSESEEEPADAALAFDPAALTNLSPAQLGGSVSVVGGPGNTASGQYTGDPGAGQEDDDDEGMESEDEDGEEDEDAPNNNPHFRTSAPWDPMGARHRNRTHTSENDGDNEDIDDDTNVGLTDEEVARKFAEKEREGRELAERVRRMEEGDDDGEL